ncbi:glycosyltransferase family 25 protein [Acinetobacter rathckeae]|uniref:glycosyltransferase family 25 protein n=1 Tax=Acinetobacter rathckeae TaxID=2605272 RepID=UPI0018A260B1|nr:glycosyltransferase family 25 protein [Acinetobacter rathckeae]MBF7687779.1 glycosyltransferase family 25 protein [Acinetobacter rathckeae]MBF7687998.1 glycosyltransferase family 25 protein [Acinetobacter rathckeae]MBF7695948.1 glycosyltransferase family 25 protein [Acinetobacter rathckeae]
MNVSFYLINLDSSVERLSKADAELSAQDIHYTKISAVDGRQMDLSSYSNYDDKKAHAFTGRALLGAEIGCYLSHQKAVEAFLASGANYGVVLEDDLKLSCDLGANVFELLKWLEENQHSDWHLIHLAAQKKKLSAKITQLGQHELLHAYYFPTLTTGLLWSKKGAEAFLTRVTSQPIYAPIDVELQAWLSKTGQGLSVYPALVGSTGLDSEIDASAATNHQKRLRKDRFLPRQKRMWLNKCYALKHLLVNK